MFRFFRALDPRRSLATAVAWLAVTLSLAVALALVAVGNFAESSMLAQRDAHMQRFARQFAGELERVLASETHAGVLPPRDRLDALASAARARAKPDARARVLLFDRLHGVVFEHGGDAPVQQLPGVLPALAIVPAPAGRTVVVTAADDAAPTLAALGLHVAVLQPSDETGHGGDLQEKLTAISVLLSITAALIGAAFAQRLTRRLAKLTAQVRRVGRQEADGIEEPAGRDEVAVLGRAFSRLLQALRREHQELDQLTQELEQRVAARTREVERLAAENRYAAVLRERLRLARDLHDTLAHSMMEMLVEVRTLRVLHAHDPRRLGAELKRAEELAHEGLKEAREAVTHMRLDAVRDLGLGAALAGAVNRFAERTGLEVRFSADPLANGFADERAETMFRIAEEAMRNISRHAQASHVEVALKDAGDDAIELTICDDGVGFDPGAPHPGHYGVLGIREQAELIGAELQLRSTPGAGACVQLRLRVGPEMRAVVPEEREWLGP